MNAIQIEQYFTLLHYFDFDEEAHLLDARSMIHIALMYLL